MYYALYKATKTDILRTNIHEYRIIDAHVFTFKIEDTVSKNFDILGLYIRADA